MVARPPMSSMFAAKGPRQRSLGDETGSVPASATSSARQLGLEGHDEGPSHEVSLRTGGGEAPRGVRAEAARVFTLA